MKNKIEQIRDELEELNIQRSKLSTKIEKLYQELIDKTLESKGLSIGSECMFKGNIIHRNSSTAWIKSANISFKLSDKNRGFATFELYKINKNGKKINSKLAHCVTIDEIEAI